MRFNGDMVDWFTDARTASDCQSLQGKCRIVMFHLENEIPIQSDDIEFSPTVLSVLLEREIQSYKYYHTNYDHYALTAGKRKWSQTVDDKC